MKTLKNYINGKWVYSEANRTNILPIENPGTGELLGFVPLSTTREVDATVKSAKEAFVEWKKTPIMKRVRYLYKLNDKIKANLDELTELNTMVHGKTLTEASGETQRLLENIESSFGIPHLAKGDNFPRVTKDIDAFSLYEPAGVFVHIAPFNFPAMIPFWYLSYAIACGACFIVKPSELAPTVMGRIFELIDEIGLPPGVLSLIHGDKEVSQALIEHPGVAGVCSVTSTPVARHISIECAKLGKRFLCQGGAKNFITFSESLIFNQEAFANSIANAADSVYGNTGQRCMAGSNIIGVDNIYPVLENGFMAAAKQIKVGYGMDGATDMGPLISEEAREKVLKYIEIGIKEGAKLILDGRKKRVKKYPNGYYLGPCVFTEVRPDMTIAREEIFGPVACLIRADTLDNAIKMINAHTCKTSGWQRNNKFQPFRYGNGAMFYTASGKEARQFKLDVECGNIGINIGLPAPIGYLPFAGMKDSFYGILHGQSPDVIRFFMDVKSITERWW